MLLYGCYLVPFAMFLNEQPTLKLLLKMSRQELSDTTVRDGDFFYIRVD